MSSPENLNQGNVVPQQSRKNIALTGFMAVGKSAVGRRLARRIKRPFVDLDKIIEKNEGMKVREIFSRKGEPYFRRLEKEMLQEVLRQDGQVIATGGGLVMDQDNLLLLQERSFLICLTASADTLLRRAGAARGRPLLRGSDRKKRVVELLKNRQERYAHAHAMIDTSHRSVDEVVEEIIKALDQLATHPSPSGRGRG